MKRASAELKRRCTNHRNNIGVDVVNEDDTVSSDDDAVDVVNEDDTASIDDDAIDVVNEDDEDNDVAK